MKPICLFLLVSSLSWGTALAHDPSNEALQKGLLEEEVNQNIGAAIDAYQSVLRLFDEQRKVAATATYRLGECYRKQGKTNEAIAQYLRVTRDFPDQSALVALSQRFLVRSTPDNTALRSGTDPAKSNSPMIDSEQAKLLREEMALVDKQIEGVQRALENGRASTVDLIHLKRELLGLARKLPENAPPAQQQALIEQEIQYVQQLLAECRKRIEVGAAGPADEIPIQRDLLALRRDLLVAQEAAKPRFQTRLQSIVRRDDAAEAPTEEESKAIQRIQELIVNSPDLINARDERGLTPLQDAAGKGQLAVARFLLDNHADVNATTRPRNTTERTALHIASGAGHKAMVELLLARGAAVNARDLHDDTPLHEAAQNGFQAVIQLLLAKGAEVNARDQSGSTPLHAAITGVQRGTAEFLITNKADINAQDNAKFTPLMRAVTAKRMELVELLLGYRADVNVKGAGDSTALTESITQNTGMITELLLKRGADPNVKGISFKGPSPSPLKMAPLHQAAAAGNLGLIELLLRHNALINLQDDLGRTALIVAISQPSEAASELLLTKRADPNVSDAQGHTGLSLAVASGQETVVRQLVDKGAKVDYPLPGGGTVLFTLVEQGRKELVDLLLADGADPNVKSLEGYTPLHVAAANGQTNVIEALLAKGVEINRQDNFGNTPLHYAAYNLARSSVLLLLAHGARPEIRNAQNETAAEMMGLAQYRQGSRRWGIPSKGPGPTGPRSPLGAVEQGLQRLLTPQSGTGEK